MYILSNLGYDRGMKNIIALCAVASLFLSGCSLVPVRDKDVQKEEVKYVNTEYGFSVALPESWNGFSVVNESWEGIELDSLSSAKVLGPKISIRHPLWTAQTPRQDIPVMIFTPAQWDLVLQEKLSLGAAPIGPSELARNTNYIFALPARYNYAFPEGFEEVKQIIDNKSVSAF